MMSLILLLVGLVGQWLLGLAIADFLLGAAKGHDKRDRPTARGAGRAFVERAGLGLILGIGASAALLFLWSLCGGLLGRGPSLAITALGYIAGGLFFQRQLRQKSTASPVATEQDPDAVREQRWCHCCQFLIAMMFVVTLIQALLTPQHLWDERASFAIKGIVLWQDRSIDSRDLTDPDFVQFHPRYPLLIPLAEQHVYALLGHLDDRLAKVIFPLLFLGMVLTMAGGLMSHVTEGSAWLFALLLATIPVLVPWEYGFACGQADAPMACFHGASVLYLWKAWERLSDDNPIGWFRLAVIAGLCGALAAFTKDEGIAFLMVDAIAIALALMAGPRWFEATKVFLTFCGVAGTLLLPWMLHRRGLPLTTEANYFGRISLSAILQNQAVMKWEIPHLISRLFLEFREWGLQWWLMLFGAIAAPSRLLARSQLFLLLDVVGAILFLMLAGILAATEVSEHIGGSSHRYLMQLAPVAILFAAGQLARRQR